MSKKFLVRFLYGITALVAVVLFLLNVLEVSGFGLFTGTFCLACVGVIWGVLMILSAFGKDVIVTKKIKVFIGCALLAFGIIYLIIALVTKDNQPDWSKITLPIIGIVVIAALLISLLVTGGKKWDTADNQKVGYKNYHERKKDEEAAQQKEDKNK